MLKPPENFTGTFFIKVEVWDKNKLQPKSNNYTITVVIKQKERAKEGNRNKDLFWINGIALHENKLKKDIEVKITNIDMNGYVTIKFSADPNNPFQLLPIHPYVSHSPVFLTFLCRRHNRSIPIAKCDAL